MTAGDAAKYTTKVVPCSDGTERQGTTQSTKGHILVNSISSQAGAEPLLMKMSSMFVEKDTGSRILESKPKPRIKRHMGLARKVYTSNWTTILMGIVSIFALYGEDLKLAHIDKTADGLFVHLIAASFLLFLLEMFLGCIADSTYKLSFFFWLDLAATLSLLADIPWFLKSFGIPLIQTATDIRAGRVARAGTKAGRLIRFVRLVRVVNVFRIGMKKTETKAHQDIHSEYEETTPSALGKELSSLITRKVIIGVLVMMFAIPALGTHDTIEPVQPSEFIDLLELSSKSMSHEGQQHLIKDVTTESQGKTLIIFLVINDIEVFANKQRLNELRFSELEVIHSSSGMSRAVLDMKDVKKTEAHMSMLLTTFLIVILGGLSLTFSKDISSLVILPIENMVSRVRRIADDPLNQKLVEDNDIEIKSKFETRMLDQTIKNIVSLLALGFGEAGREVIRDYLLSNNRLNNVLPGRKVHAIFGFCDIRQFTDTTECLQEDVMKFTNVIARIVHEHTHFYGGSCNKNIGDAFLLVWKLPEGRKVHEPTTTLADNALLAFLKIISDINRSSELQKYRKHPSLRKRFPNYKVRMGFGLHVGWAIEGAIGSRFKIDASYLSPNVNLAARLESATKQFNVNILFSDSIHHLLSPAVKIRCRQIDTVIMKGSVQPIGLFTYDTVNPSPLARPKRSLQRPLTKEEVEFIYKNDTDVIGLQRGLHQGLLSQFAVAFRAYSSGDWQHAKKELERCLELMPSDGPSISLMGSMANTNFQAPADWEGYRRLKQK